MPSTPRPPRITVGKHRVEALADGVFAIVLTLLVLELKVPDLPRHVARPELFHAIRELGPVFLTFFLTFLLAGLYWYQHHLALHYVDRSDRIFVWLNLGFLCFVSLLPFSCALFGRFLRVQGVPSVYYSNQALIGFFLLAIWYYARTRLVRELDPWLDHRLRTRLLMLPAALTGAAVISWWYPDGAIIPFIFGALYVRIQKRRFTAATASATHAADA